jgi:DNA-binding transcriptional LysR family regulator
MQIERHEVRVLDAVIENGGFSRAAERLNLSQSAVSQAIANLEHKLGTRLVVRGRRPELTEAGRRMYSYARMLLVEEQQTLEDIALIKTGALSTLSLATNSMVNRYFARDLMLKFCTDNPFTRLKLDVVPSKEIIYGVDEDRWELGFGPLQSAMPQHFDIRVYFDEHRILCVHRNHPHFDALMKDPASHLNSVTLLTSYLDEATKRDGESRLSDQFAAVWEISNLDLRLALAADGKGVTYLSDRLLKDEPGLVEIPGLPISRIPRQVGVFYKKHEPLSTGAQHFLSICDRRFAPA